MSFQSALGYAGDVLATDAYQLLAGNAASTLIDVRTHAECAYVGAPNLEALGKSPLFLEWQSYPSMQVHGCFVELLSGMLEHSGVERGAALLFLCRSAAPSRKAAIAMPSAG